MSENMPFPPCIYRDLADEGFRIDAETGKETRIDVWLCTWPTTISAAPAWFTRRIGPSPAIEPDRDCMNCPVRKDR
jgi:hypothetical protein